MKFGNELRPCIVANNRALFHMWVEFEMPEYDGDVIVASRKTVNAVVELDDGTVMCVSPRSVRFLDSVEVFSRYDWRENT